MIVSSSRNLIYMIIDLLLVVLFVFVQSTIPTHQQTLEAIRASNVLAAHMMRLLAASDLAASRSLRSLREVFVAATECV